MIEKKTELGEAIDFLVRAERKNEKCPHYGKVIFVDEKEKNLVSTDGRRLHIATLNFKPYLEREEFLEDNVVFEIVSAGKYFTFEKKDIQFPNYKRVIPDVKNMKELETGPYYFEKLKRSNIEKVSDLSHLTYDLAEEGVYIQVPYLLDLHSITWEKVYVPTESGKASVFISEKDTNITYTAVVMPLDKEKRKRT